MLSIRSVFRGSLFGLGGVSLLAPLAAGCSAEPDGQELFETGQISEGLLKCSGGTNGDADYCDASCLCSAGEGNCNGSTECSAGLICRPGYGPRYGLPAGTDVCVTAACGNGAWDANECFVDCGGTSGCGTCTTNFATKSCGGTNGGDLYCFHPQVKCTHGEGNCHNSSQCEAGLTCVPGAGPKYGLPAGIDVCVNTNCSNGIWDANECFVDCGGTSGCGTCTTNFATKSCGGTNGGDLYCFHPQVKCTHGEGNCHNSSQCEAGLTCVPGAGPRFGLPAGIDVCVSASCSNGIWDATECGIDCGGTSGCGTCATPLLTKGCGGSNGGAEYCRNPNNLCTSGEGNCGSSADCVAGLVCGNGNGPKFGLSAGINVCVPAACANGVQDADEGGIDCGGTSACGQCAGSAFAWAKRFGDAAPQEGRGVAVDVGGNVYVVGVFQGTVDFGGGVLTSVGANDVFVAKFDAAGTHLWSKQFGDLNNQLGLGIALDSANNILIGGAFGGTLNFGGTDLVSSGGNHDIWIAKLDTNGAHLWSQAFGASAEDQQGWSIDVDSSNNVYFTGYYRNSFSFGGGALPAATDWHAFLVKFDSAGTHQWSKGFGDAGAGQTFSRSVAVDASGNAYISGQFNATADFGGGVLTSAGMLDAYVAKFDTSGNHVWSQRFGDAQNQQGRRVTVDSAGNVIFHGYIQGSANFGCGAISSAGGFDTFLAKLNSAGTCVFSNRYGDGSDQFGESLATDDSTTSSRAANSKAL